MQTAVLSLLGLASLLAGFIFRLVLPGQKYYAWAILAIGVALLAVAVILDFRRMSGALASRRGKFGIGTTVKVSLFAGIVVLANAISVGAYHRFDFTGLAQFTLTSQTKDVLADLNEPVEVVSFFTPTIPATISGYARDLLAEYQNYTDKITVKEIDPELNPDQAREYGINRYGEYYGQLYGIVVFRSEEGQRDVFGLQIAAEAEHAFTSAILEVTGTRQKTVYFLTGHGESSVTGEYSDARSGLRDNLFQVGEVDLLYSGGVPSNAAALVIAGPQQQLGTDELEILKDYLQSGGRLFMLLNPNSPDRYRQLLTDWWIKVDEGTIIDPDSYVAPNEDNLLVPRTRNAMGLVETYFPGATGMMPTGDVPDNVEMTPIAWSSPDSWLENGDIISGKPKFDDGVDEKGPIFVGMTVTGSKSTDLEEEVKTTRIAVMGDSDFAANQHFQNGNNSDLFLNMVNWLTQGEEIISVDRKVLPARRLILDPEEERFLHISSIGLLPLLLLLTGGYVWWRRR